MRENRQREIDEATREAVKQYRLSREYFRRKDSYASCFSKFGFYLCHNFMESWHPGDFFSEVTFDNAMSARTPSDWRKYEPNDPCPVECIRQALKDDLSNLQGPWSPYILELEECEMDDDTINTVQMIEKGLKTDLAADASQSLLPGEGLGHADHLSVED